MSHANKIYRKQHFSELRIFSLFLSPALLDRDSSHPRLSQVETEPPKCINLLVFKFTNDSYDLALMECKHQAKETPVLPGPRSPSCRQASWRVRFSEGCSQLMKSKPEKHCDLRISRPSSVIAALWAAGHSRQATPNRALPCPGWGGGGGPVQAAL